MTVKEISVTYGGKINMGDYNSAHIEATASALLEPGESETDALRSLMETVQDAVRVEARKLAARRNARVDEIFAGLPVEAREQINGGRQ